jgi:hypothetical protein
MSEAAERLRRVANGESHKDVYGRSGAGGAADEEHDRAEVAAAYLAATDPTPVDEAWLESCGLMICTQGDSWHLLTSHGSFAFYRDGSWSLSSYTEGDKRRKRWTDSGGGVCKTRGQFRRLCAALGIELSKEAT